MKTKAELRIEFSETPMSINEAEMANRDILSNVDSIIHNAKGIIGIYLPIEGEVDVSPIMVKYPGHQFALPKIIEDEMYFAKYSMGYMLQNNPDYPRIMEPKSDNFVTPQIILVPALAYDIKGNRLGRGAGHYDKYFGRYKDMITKVGISFNKNIIESLPTEDHDCSMDYLVSEEMVLKIK